MHKEFTISATPEELEALSTLFLDLSLMGDLEEVLQPIVDQFEDILAEEQGRLG